MCLQQGVDLLCESLSTLFDDNFGTKGAQNGACLERMCITSWWLLRITPPPPPPTQKILTLPRSGGPLATPPSRHPDSADQPGIDLPPGFPDLGRLKRFLTMAAQKSFQKGCNGAIFGAKKGKDRGFPTAVTCNGMLQQVVLGCWRVFFARFWPLHAFK